MTDGQLLLTLLKIIDTTGKTLAQTPQLYETVFNFKYKSVLPINTPAYRMILLSSEIESLNAKVRLPFLISIKFSFGKL